MGRLSGTVPDSAGLRQEIPAQRKLLWESDFEDGHGIAQWQITRMLFGSANYRVVDDPDGSFGKVLRIAYPAGSWSPANTQKAGLTVGGLGFMATCGIQPRDQLHLRYYVRFENGFDFVKGGKLPGLYGGKGNGGGDIPNGRDGFSARLMWRHHGDGEVYAYIPTKLWPWGVSIGRGNWRFDPGRWYLIEQQLALNTPGKKDGVIRLWVNEKLAIEQGNLRFRDIDNLKIDGLMFSTFFGGSDASWATPHTTYVYFDRFALSDNYIGP